MKAARSQVLKEADSLKSLLTGETPSSEESWQRRQKLCSLLEHLLLTDLEYALDKKVEQDLWNYVFRNPILAFQTKAKDKVMMSNMEVQSQLSTLLEAASGFYLQLLQKLCCVHDVELPCHPRDSSFGIIRGKEKCIDRPLMCSVLYLCQHCLVHLGDIARYRGQSLQAETFYRHAIELGPSNGQLYNQLALLEAASGEKLSTVFFYVRSLAVPHPFPAAAKNLQKLFTKMVTDRCERESKLARMSSYEYISAFLQFHAFIHLGSGFQKAQQVLCQLVSSLPALIIAEKLETWQLVQISALCMFAIEHAWGHIDYEAEKSTEGKPEVLSDDEQLASSLILEMMASMLHAFLLPVHALMEPRETMSYSSIPAVKLLIEWLVIQPRALMEHAFIRKPQVWHGLCKLLNDLEVAISDFDGSQYAAVPLPEDWDLQCFVPLQKAHKPLKFQSSTTLSEEEIDYLRALRLCELGLKLANLPSSYPSPISCKRVDSKQKFEACQYTDTLAEQTIRQIQELTLITSSNYPQGTGVESQAPHSWSLAGKNLQEEGSMPEVRFKLDEDHLKQDFLHLQTDDEKVEQRRASKGSSGQGAKERRGGRQNVAMQAILQRATLNQDHVGKPKDNMKDSVRGYFSDKPLDMPQPPQVNPPMAFQQNRPEMLNMGPSCTMQSDGVMRDHMDCNGRLQSGPVLMSGCPQTNMVPRPSYMTPNYMQPPPIVPPRHPQQNCYPPQLDNKKMEHIMHNPPMPWNYYNYMSPSLQPAAMFPGSAPSQMMLPPTNRLPQQQPGFMIIDTSVQQPPLESQGTPYMTEMGLAQMGNQAEQRGGIDGFRDAPPARVWQQEGNMGHCDGGYSLGHGNMAPPLPVASHQPNRMSQPKASGTPVMGASDTNTYSLFNSPWSSGLTAPRSLKDGSRVPPGGGNLDPLLMQPRIQEWRHQSLWSGPGPSPLERLLEQQKQWRDNAAQ